VLGFDRMKAVSYVDYLVVEERMEGKSVNTKVSYMKSMFNQMLAREVIRDNPFVRLKKRKEIKSFQNLAYTDEEIKLLKEKILEKDPQLWTFIQFNFYCYLRPAELSSLTREHVNVRTCKIFIPATISKNGIEGYVDIPGTFMEYLKSINFFEGRRGYLFTNSAGNKLCKNDMSQRHRAIRDELGMDTRHTLYA
jgi:integrase